MPATFGSLPRELVQRVFTASRTPVQGPFAEDNDDFEDLPWLVLSLRDRWGQRAAPPVGVSLPVSPVGSLSRAHTRWDPKADLPRALRG